MTMQDDGLDEPQADRSLPPGYRLDEYVIRRTLGSGGFGITYLGEDTHLAHQVAIKEYFPFQLAGRSHGCTVTPHVHTRESLSAYQWGLDRFIEEARTLARFKHPNIVRVVRYMERNGTAYIVMDFAEGRPLSDVIKQDGPLGEHAIRSILLPLLDGLRAVHAERMLHRDIKPQNIIIRPDGSPVLIDFGAARQAIGSRSRSISTILTPGYAPLEQYWSKGNQGPWTDLYALGAVAYACLMAASPPEAQELQRDWQALNLATVGRGRAGQDFLAAIDWAMRPEEKDRPQSVEQWRPALAGGIGLTEGRTVIATDPGPAPTEPPVSKLPLAAAGLLFVGALVVVGVLLVEPGSPSLGSGAERRPAQPQVQAPMTPLQPEVASVPQTAPPTADPVAEAKDNEAFATAIQIGTPEAYAVYLKLYPDGRHAESARRNARGS